MVCAMEIVQLVALRPLIQIAAGSAAAATLSATQVKPVLLVRGIVEYATAMRTRQPAIYFPAGTVFVAAAPVGMSAGRFPRQPAAEMTRGRIIYLGGMLAILAVI